MMIDRSRRRRLLQPYERRRRRSVLLECVCVFASIRVTIIMRHMRHILLALSISHANSFFQQQQHRTPPKQFTSSRESSSSRPSSLPTTPKAWVLSTFLAGSVLFGQPFLPMGGPPAAFADGTLTPNQRIVAEAWKAVDKQFYDRSFNGHEDWFKLRDEYAKRRDYASKEDAYEGVAELLAKLDDPYTRFLPPAKFDSLVNSATATVGGVGVELLDGTKQGVGGGGAGGGSSTARKKGGVVVVGDVQPNSPAERAGVHT